MASRAGTIRLLALCLGFLLTVGATTALVFTDDVQILRLAVIAALWGLVIAAFLVGRRGSAGDAVPGAEIALRNQDLELERERALRREYELRTEVQVRREIEGTLREDVAALRGDLSRLRHDILERWDGELRVERVAVTAESTRVSGFGAAFQALQDEARRLGTDSRPVLEMDTSAPHSSPAGDTLENVSTIEFTAVPPLPADIELSADSGQSAYPPAVPVSPRDPSAGSRRARHDAEDAGAGVDASALVSRLRAEASSTGPLPAARRRRARADDETNDVLARVLGS